LKKIVLGLIFIVLSLNVFASVESEVDKKRFKRINDVLVDFASEMSWQDNKDAKIIEKNWDSAVSYCKNLNLNDKNDWRLPTRSELVSTKNIKHIFNNITLGSNGRYWSSTVRHWKPNYIGFDTYNSDAGKNWELHVRCVRGKSFDYDGVLEDKINKYIEIETLIIKKRKIKEQKIRKNKIKQNKIKEQKIRNKKQKNAYVLVKETNTINSYEKFIKKHPRALQVKDATSEIYILTSKQNNIAGYEQFIKSHPKSSLIENATSEIYNLTKKENNIIGYEWFIKNYPKASQVKDAIKNINLLAFAKAKAINTLSSYNTFIISYPYASQIKEAVEMSSNVEAKKYTMIKKDDERKARLLAVKIKKMTIRARKSSNDLGYQIVINRMSNLLTTDYEETDASLRYYESKEFTEFASTFESSMNEITSVLNEINSNTKKLSEYAKEMVEISQDGFASANADRDMAAFHTEQKTKWDKYMHLRDKGYN